MSGAGDRPARRSAGTTATAGSSKAAPGGDRQAPSREATEQALIDAAVRLLRERGVLAGMNLREIADEAGVTRGLAYHYFGSRQALLREAARREIARPREEVEGGAAMSFGEWFAAMLDQTLDFKEAVRLIVLLALDHDESVRTLTTRRTVMARIAEEVAGDHLAVDDGEAIYAAYASMSYGFSLLHEHFAEELGCDPADLEERMLAVTRRMFVGLERRDGADPDTST